MSAAGLNVNVGIDTGSYSSKLACDNKIIATIPTGNRASTGSRPPTPDLLTLREEAEIYVDEPVFSCVIAVSNSLGTGQREELIFKAKKSGFKNVEIISKHEAISNAVDGSKRQSTGTPLAASDKVLVCDFGASGTEFIFFRNSEVIDSEIIGDVSGFEIDRIFAQWLCERFTLNLIKKEELLELAEKFKKELSHNEALTWRNIEITRENFERLIYFSIKRTSHTLERFIKCFNPERFIMTGGCSEIPLTKKIFSDLFPNTELIKDLTVLGASARADSLSSARERKQRSDSNAKLREIRGALISLEDLLTRKQKDRLYFLFRQAEGILPDSPAMIKLLENLINEIKTASLKKN